MSGSVFRLQYVCIDASTIVSYAYADFLAIVDDPQEHAGGSEGEGTHRGTSRQTVRVAVVRYTTVLDERCAPKRPANPQSPGRRYPSSKSALVGHPGIESVFQSFKSDSIKSI